jgi:hypothetical protein
MWWCPLLQPSGHVNHSIPGPTSLPPPTSADGDTPTCLQCSKGLSHNVCARSKCRHLKGQLKQRRNQTKAQVTFNHAGQLPAQAELKRARGLEGQQGRWVPHPWLCPAIVLLQVSLEWYRGRAAVKTALAHLKLAHWAIPEHSAALAQGFSE